MTNEIQFCNMLGAQKGSLGFFEYILIWDDAIEN